MARRRQGNALHGQVTWVSTPPRIVNVGMACALFAYCSETMTFPRSALLPMLVSACAVAACLSPLSLYAYSRSAPVLSSLGRGKRAPDAEALALAARELHRFPDLIFWIVLTLWTCGILAAAAILGAFTGLPVQVLARPALVAILLAPAGALLSYLLTTLRARRATELLVAQGLGSEALVRAVPPARRQMRPRLMVFSFILVTCPALLTADLAVSTIHQEMQRVRAISDPHLKATAGYAALDHALVAVLVLGALILAFALLIAWAGGRVLGQPLKRLAAGTQQLASGDLRAGAPVPAEDELWMLSCAFEGVRTRLVRVLSGLANAGQTLAGATQELGAISAKTREASQGQAAALAQTSSVTQQLSVAAQRIADNATQVARSAETTLDSTRSGQAWARRLAMAVSHLRAQNLTVSGAVAALEEKVRRIGEIIQFINRVTDKTDLLALNAALEGTKAGEVGRGFSLVASEMRRAAEQVTSATREIEAHIRRVGEAGATAASASVESASTMELGEQLARDFAESLSRIRDLAQATATAAAQISRATGQQRTSTEQLAASMANVLEVTRADADATTQMANAATDLSSVSRELHDAVRRFEVG